MRTAPSVATSRGSVTPRERTTTWPALIRSTSALVIWNEVVRKVRAASSAWFGCPAARSSSPTQRKCRFTISVLACSGRPLLRNECDSEALAPVVRLSARFLEVGHRCGHEHPSYYFGKPSGSSRGACHACAIGRDARVRVHLSVETRDQYKGQSCPERADTSRPLPDCSEAVELVLDLLGARPDFLRRHRWMR